MTAIKRTRPVSANTRRRRMKPKMTHRKKYITSSPGDAERRHEERLRWFVAGMAACFAIMVIAKLAAGV